MWYFAWALGLGFAALVGILNAMWFELKRTRQADGTEPAPILGQEP